MNPPASSTNLLIERQRLMAEHTEAVTAALRLHVRRLKEIERLLRAGVKAKRLVLPVKVGDRMYRHFVSDACFGVFSERRVKVGTVEEFYTVQKVGPKCAHIGCHMDGYEEAKVRLSHLLVFGAGYSSLTRYPDCLWSLQRDIDTAGVIAAIRKYVEDERRENHIGNGARIDELRKVLQREHPDRGGNTEKFMAAKRTFDRLRNRASGSPA